MSEPMKLRFKIDSISLPVPKQAEGMKLLRLLGVNRFAFHKEVDRFDVDEIEVASTFQLGGERTLELETFERDPSLSCIFLGFVVSKEECAAWASYMRSKGIEQLAVTTTESHRDPMIDPVRHTSRHVYYDTKEILGVNIRFTIREDIK